MKVYIKWAVLIFINIATKKCKRALLYISLIATNFPFSLLCYSNLHEQSPTQSNGGIRRVTNGSISSSDPESPSMGETRTVRIWFWKCFFVCAMIMGFRDPKLNFTWDLRWSKLLVTVASWITKQEQNTNCKKKIVLSIFVVCKDNVSSDKDFKKFIIPNLFRPINGYIWLKGFQNPESPKYEWNFF